MRVNIAAILTQMLLFSVSIMLSSGCEDNPQYVNTGMYASLEEALANPTEVKLLWLTDDPELIHLPLAIGTMTSMELLYIDNTGLEELPDTLSSLKSLTALHATNCDFNTFPDNIGKFRFLDELDLSDNQFYTLSSSIGSLGKLQYLKLNDNRIGQLPAEIGQMISLRELYLMNNQLKTLPDEVGLLKDNLQILRLEQNTIDPFERLHIKSLLPNTKITY